MDARPTASLDERTSKVPGASAERVSRDRHQHHHDHFHDIARTQANDDVLTLRRSELAVRAVVHCAVEFLCVVQQHVADRTQPFLQRLDELAVAVGHSAAIVL